MNTSSNKQSISQYGRRATLKDGRSAWEIQIVCDEAVAMAFHLARLPDLLFTLGLPPVAAQPVQSVQSPAKIDLIKTDARTRRNALKPRLRHPLHSPLLTPSFLIASGHSRERRHCSPRHFLACMLFRDPYSRICSYLDQRGLAFSL